MSDRVEVIKLAGFLDADQVADCGLGPLVTVLADVVGVCRREGVRPVGTLTTRSGEPWQGGPPALFWRRVNMDPTDDEVARYRAFVAGMSGHE
jgi:hypothetical protein